ncbi:MAG: hemerythrin domain-containing protein [Planctomycetota bacterium]|jgi:hemerythrin-like domain-containing protein
MSDPIQTLMDEHRTIEKVLDALEAAAGKEVPFPFYERAIDFLSSYADRCHHAKEEDRLFPLMEQRGIPRQMGPIGVMCDEHVLGRGHIQRMRELVASEDRDGLRQESLAYVALLRQHIQKEDNVLFVMARDIMSADDVQRLEQEFAEQTAAHCDARYPALAEELRAEAGVEG